MSSTGIDKWKKYFQGVQVETKVTKDTNFYASAASTSPMGVIRAETPIVVLESNAYTPKLKARVNEAEVFVPLTVIAKPIARSIGRVRIKPNELNISGDYTLVNLYNTVIGNLEKASAIEDVHREYLIDLVKYSQGKIRSNELSASFEETKKPTSLISAVNNDFLEIIGAFHAAKQMNANVIYFPSSGSEPLYDFKVKTRAKETDFSSKTSSSKTTNVLKPGSIIQSIDALTARRFPSEMKIIEIIDAASIKTAPIELAAFLKTKFRFDFDLNVNYAQDLKKLWELERDVIKFINAKFNFIDLIRSAIPDLYYIKGEIDRTGIPSFKIEVGQELKSVTLRSKNASTGRFKDKLGFQM